MKKKYTKDMIIQELISVSSKQAPTIIGLENTIRLCAIAMYLSMEKKIK